MLESVWFILWGVLWAVYFMLDGFDLGLGTLMPVFARNDGERRMIYDTMRPFWDGNEVWLITAGGVTFAAFPTTYAVMFSSLYSALMLILFSLILRGVAFEYRDKVEDPRWKAVWDKCLVVGSFAPALLLGVAFANIFQGIPIDGSGIFHGSLFTLLNPYGLLGGILFVLLFTTHGSIWLAVKSEGALQERAVSMAQKLWVALAVMVVVFLSATWYSTHLYDNYLKNPFFFTVPIVLIPLVVAASLVMMRVYIGKSHWWRAWFASSALIVGVTLFGVAGLYPNLLPSSLSPEFSLTIYNSASSPLTLKIMLGVALTFVPVVIIYQAWVYRLFKDKVSAGPALDDELY
ncbi:MAG: cytochrome d ubiquinol oxidase subunit II [Syntrophobacteraceae bacterium]